MSWTLLAPSACGGDCAAGSTLEGDRWVPWPHRHRPGTVRGKGQHAGFPCSLDLALSRLGWDSCRLSPGRRLLKTTRFHPRGQHFGDGPRCFLG